MADERLVHALAECLDALRVGDAELDTCLTRHAGLRRELEALLAVASSIPRLPADLIPDDVFLRRVRSTIAELPRAFDVAPDPELADNPSQNP